MGRPGRGLALLPLILHEGGEAVKGKPCCSRVATNGFLELSKGW